MDSNVDLSLFGMLRETLEEAYTERGSSRPVVQREAVALREVNMKSDLEPLV